MKRSILFVVAVFFALCGYAQKWLDAVPESYQVAACKQIKDPASLCNQGDEPFSAFMSKFNMSAQYRQERTKVTANTPEFQNEGDALANAVSFLKTYKAVPMRDYNGKVNMSTWFYVTENMVGYSFPSGVLCFERVGGKWYCVAALLAG